MYLYDSQSYNICWLPWCRSLLKYTCFCWSIRIPFVGVYVYLSTCLCCIRIPAQSWATAHQISPQIAGLMRNLSLRRWSIWHECIWYQCIWHQCIWHERPRPQESWWERLRHFALSHRDIQHIRRERSQGILSGWPLVTSLISSEFKAQQPQGGGRKTRTKRKETSWQEGSKLGSRQEGSRPIAIWFIIATRFIWETCDTPENLFSDLWEMV